MLKKQSIILLVIFSLLLILPIGVATNIDQPNRSLRAQEINIDESIQKMTDTVALRTLLEEYKQKISDKTKVYRTARVSFKQEIKLLKKLAVKSKNVRYKNRLRGKIEEARQEFTALRSDHINIKNQLAATVNKIKKRHGEVVTSPPVEPTPVLPPDSSPVIPADKLEIGGFMFDRYNTVPYVENLMDNRFDIFLHYQSISEDFDVNLANWLWARGTKLQLSFEPHKFGIDPNNQPQYRLTTISNGDHDAALRRWARQIKDFGRPVYFRPMCEMNGDWVVWSGISNGNQPADYIPAWRHIHNIFKQEGANNALFIWAPNVDTSLAKAVQTFTLYYPGDAYVDYVGMNGYNWGTTQKTPTWTSWWRTFSEIFGPSYSAFTARTSKPMMIPEMASADPGGNKAEWIRDAFYQLRTNFTRIKAITWFNVDKETDWRFHNTSTNLESFKTNAWPATP